MPQRHECLDLGQYNRRKMGGGGGGGEGFMEKRARERAREREGKVGKRTA